MIGVETRASAAWRPWVGVTLAWLASLSGLVAWLRATSTGTLREQLKVAQFWSLEICVLLAVVVTVWTAARMRITATRRDVVWVAVVTSAAVALTLWAAPRTNRIFYDEQIYQSIGQNLSDLRRAQVCNDGHVSDGRLQCASGEYNKQPYAYPHLLSVAYRIVGVHEWVAFAVNAIVMALTVIAVYALVVSLFDDRQAAAFASLIVALIPEQLIWSATAAVEPAASLACLVAVLCAARYRRSGGRLAGVALVIATAYAIQFRPESILIVAVLGVVAWPRLREQLEKPAGWWAAVLLLLLVAVPVAHLFAVRNAGWGTEAARFSARYLAANFAVNGRFYVLDERFPVVVSLLACIGVAGRGTARWSLALWFALFFGVDLVFYAGSYNYGADVRYSLMTYPAIAALAGVGVARLARWAGSRVSALPAAPLLTAILAFQFLWYLPVVRATTEEAWAARADVRFARVASSELPADSYVLTQNPGMFQVWGVGAGQMSQVLATPGYAALLARRYSGGVYLHWNFWCNVDDPVQRDLCHRAMALGTPELVAEHRERDQRYAFYRLKIAN
jgi:dolichyl-phosphate-mannose-protein mannosyltransferase